MKLVNMKSYLPQKSGAKEVRTEVFNFPATGGCGLSMYNTKDSINDFA